MRYASCVKFSGNLYSNPKTDYCSVKKTNDFECYYCERYMKTLSPKQIEARRLKNEKQNQVQ